MAGPGNNQAEGRASSGWLWDVALSFASPQRDYVEAVATALKARGVRVFYDADEQIDLWGKDLAEELQTIYGEQAATVVVFVSADYASRDWTRQERRAALSRAVRERREYVLPARFDDTPLPGLPSDMVTVNLRIRTPQEFAEMIISKLTTLKLRPISQLIMEHKLANTDEWTAELVSREWINKLASQISLSSEQLRVLQGLKQVLQAVGKSNEWIVRISLAEEHYLYLKQAPWRKLQVIWLDGAKVYQGKLLVFHQFDLWDAQSHPGPLHSRG